MALTFSIDVQPGAAVEWLRHRLAHVFNLAAVPPQGIEAWALSDGEGITAALIEEPPYDDPEAVSVVIHSSESRAAEVREELVDTVQQLARELRTGVRLISPYDEVLFAFRP